MALERLDKILSSTGRWSRKEIKDMVRHGRVRADGMTVAKPEDKFDPAAAHIQVDGQRVDCAPFVYVLMHKPAGCCPPPGTPSRRRCWTCCRSICGGGACSPWGGWTRTPPACCCSPTTAPWATNCSPPKSTWTRSIWPRWRAGWTRATWPPWAAGHGAGGRLHCLPAGLQPLGDGSSCLVTLREGKYHQVKRMLAARGKPVTALHRLSMGPLKLEEELKPGQWRTLTENEIAALRGEL